MFAVGRFSGKSVSLFRTRQFLNFVRHTEYANGNFVVFLNLSRRLLYISSIRLSRLSSKTSQFETALSG